MNMVSQYVDDLTSFKHGCTMNIVYPYVDDLINFSKNLCAGCKKKGTKIILCFLIVFCVMTLTCVLFICIYWFFIYYIVDCR